MANTLDITRFPVTSILTDKNGKVGAEVVSSAPVAGQSGLVVYPVTSATATPTQDAADGTPGATAPAVALQVGGTDGTNLRALLTDTSGRLEINISSEGNANSSAATWNSTTTNNTALTLFGPSPKYSTLIVTLNPTNTSFGGGSLNFEVSQDNSNWVPIDYAFINSSGQLTASFSGTNVFDLFSASSWGGSVVYTALQFAVDGWQYFRIRLSPAITSTGTVVIGYFLQTNTDQAGQLMSCLGTTSRLASSALTVMPLSGTTTPVSIAGTVTVSDTTHFVATAAGGDAVANPTLTKVFGYSQSFNGTTWDRARNNVNTTTGDTGAKAATFNGATQTNFDATGAYITILLGAVSGGTPTLSAQFQWSPDGGTTWLNLGPATGNLTATSQNATIGIFPTNWCSTPGATPANLTTGASQTVFISAPMPRTWRLVYTIAGSTPSFTISSVQVNYCKA